MKINNWELMFKIKGVNKWLAKCSCGTEHEVYKSNIVSGKSKRCRKCQAVLQKDNTNFKTHGLSKSKLYNVWSGIKRRCYNQNQKSFKDYGAKGVVMSDEWLNSYEVFYNWAMLNGYREGLEIDRIDSDGNYESSNCRFITKHENISLAHLGKAKTVAFRDNMSISKLGWTEEYSNEVLTLCLSGDYKSDELATKLGVERHTLTRLVNRSGNPTNWRKGAFTLEEVISIRKDSSTMTYQQLIDKYNSNHETIGSIINKRGTYGSEYYLQENRTSKE